MRKSFVILIGVFLLAGVGGCVSEKAFDEVNRKLDDERTKNEALRNEMTLVKEENDTLNKQIAELRESGGASTAAPAQATAADKARLAKLQSTIDRQAKQIRTLSKKNPVVAEPPKPDMTWAEGLIADFKKSFPNETRQGEVEARIHGQRLVVTLAEKLLYEPDGVEITTHGEDVLTRVGEILNRTKNKSVEVGAHLDTTPIAPVMAREFPTAWDFTGARAVEVVRYLQEESKVGGGRLTAAAYGSDHPLVSNASEAGRARNRRVEITVGSPAGA
jgi:chemotaxis protein MotB